MTTFHTGWLVPCFMKIMSSCLQKRFSIRSSWASNLWRSLITLGSVLCSWLILLSTVASSTHWVCCRLWQFPDSLLQMYSPGWLGIAYRLLCCPCRVHTPNQRYILGALIPTLLAYHDSICRFSETILICDLIWLWRCILRYMFRILYTQIPRSTIPFRSHCNSFRSWCLLAKLITRWFPSWSSWYSSTPRLMLLASQFRKYGFLKLGWCSMTVSRYLFLFVFSMSSF